MDMTALAGKLFPAVTDDMLPCGGIRCYAQSDITCYVLRGSSGALPTVKNEKSRFNRNGILS